MGLNRIKSELIPCLKKRDEGRKWHCMRSRKMSVSTTCIHHYPIFSVVPCKTQRRTVRFRTRIPRWRPHLHPVSTITTITTTTTTTTNPHPHLQSPITLSFPILLPLIRNTIFLDMLSFTANTRPFPWTFRLTRTSALTRTLRPRRAGDSFLACCGRLVAGCCVGDGEEDEESRNETGKVEGLHRESVVVEPTDLGWLDFGRIVVLRKFLVVVRMGKWSWFSCGACSHSWSLNIPGRVCVRKHMWK